MIVTVVSVKHNRSGLFSEGIGKRDGRIVRFIMHTVDVPQLERDLKYNTDLRIDLEPWQYSKNRLG